MDERDDRAEPSQESAEPSGTVDRVGNRSNIWSSLHESPFSVFGQAGRVMVWRKVKEDMKIDNLQPTVKHGGGKVMVWGCMSAAGVGELVFIDVIDKPPQSPDCNPIENLWNELNRRLRKVSVSSKEELKRRLKKEWGRIDGTYKSRIVASMPRRLQHVIQQNGYSTRVSVCVSVRVSVVSGMSDDDEDGEGRRGNPVPARSLLLSNGTNASLNVPIRRTYHY
ncbi:hypothetical protein ANN_02895 [Periplaneta americana]|uniref:Transposable element Tc1 transposase n=1 Tax=Periplaneta americana TaxID=6978 RepID=A0ABQ8TYQ3_PERAM|nr:hypothetical protein ANN_02895 [Periplaneta americana]